MDTHGPADIEYCNCDFHGKNDDHHDLTCLNCPTMMEIVLS